MGRRRGQKLHLNLRLFETKALNTRESHYGFRVLLAHNFLHKSEGSVSTLCSSQEISLGSQIVS